MNRWINIPTLMITSSIIHPHSTERHNNTFPLGIVNAFNNFKNKTQIPTRKSGKKYTAFIDVGNETYHIMQSFRNLI